MISKNCFKSWQRWVLVFIFIPILLLNPACNLTPEREFSPPTPIPAGLPKEIEKARDAALSYIDFNYDIELPTSDIDWVVEYDFLVDEVGDGAYRLTADSCLLTISNPLIGLDSIVYHVVLDDPAAGFHWEGDVDCQGRVLPSFSTEDNAAGSVPDTINIAKIACLDKTVGIEVCRLDCASYTPLFTIKNPELVAAIIKSLDVDMPLRPHVRCPATYQLRFILADGQYYDFGYTFQKKTPTYMRGNQDFWMGQDAIAPDAFNELLLPFIAPGAPVNAAW